jgi:hypothetical protein
MKHIDWLAAVRLAVFLLVCLGIIFWLAVRTGRRLAIQAPPRDESAERIREERRAQRLKILLAIAEEYEAAPEHERQRLYREAEALSQDWNDEPLEAA